MAKPKVTSKELNALLAQVAKEVEDLQKSEDGKEAPGEKTPEGSSIEGTPDKSAPHKEPDGDEGPNPSKPSDGDGDEGGAPKGDTSAPAAPPASATPPAPPAAPAAPSAPDASAAPAPLDPQALIAEFRQMPPEEVKMFLLAAKQVVMEQGGGMGDAPAAPSGSPAAPPAPPAAPPVPPGPDGVAKGEMKASPGNGGEMKAGKLAKSEEVIALEAIVLEKDAALKKAQENAELMSAKLDEALKGITNLLSKTTLRKSISGVSYQGKPDGGSEKPAMTREQALEKVRELSASPDNSLTKSERETLNRFWMDSTMPVEKVQGILNKKEK